jgi:hypothetical protein
MLFMRGNAMSGAPIMIGTNQLPKPPIMAGMTMKKIISRPCAVTNTLYMCLPASTATPSSTPYTIWARPWKYWIPGSCNSMRMKMDRMPPTRPEKMANQRYIVPMSLWLVENR